MLSDILITYNVTLLLNVQQGVKNKFVCIYKYIHIKRKIEQLNN